jgi:hypothetical protein
MLITRAPRRPQGDDYKPDVLTEGRRRVREDVRLEEERLNPNQVERGNSSKLRNKVRCADERWLRHMITVARCDRRNRTTVLGPGRVGVHALVQLRRNTQRERPEKCGANASRNERASMVCWTRERAHCAATL